MKTSVYNGCDLITTNEGKRLFDDKKIGLVTNHSAKTRSDITVSAAMNDNYNLCALFSAEHGLNIAKQAGEADSEGYFDVETQLPVYNLYGDDSLYKKAEAVFDELDVIAFDMQDIGTRYYTYQYTLLDVLKLCKKTDKPLIVLDRINPLGCERVEGSCLSKDMISEVGRVPTQPVIAGMTIGEIALWYNASLNINAKLHILKCQNLNRSIKFEDTDLKFNYPSPNLQSLDAIFLYAGTCLFEGTNLSEGRGTDYPFEVFGAPWTEPQKIINELTNYPDNVKKLWDGLTFIPTEFTPTFSDYENCKCNGIKLVINDKSKVKPFETALYILEVLSKLYGTKLQKNLHLANLVGSDTILSESFSATQFLNSQKNCLDSFICERENFLIYD